MGKLLETSLPLAPVEYDQQTMVRLVQLVERALTTKEMPSVISGEDDTNGMNWFDGVFIVIIAFSVFIVVLSIALLEKAFRLILIGKEL